MKQLTRAAIYWLFLVVWTRIYKWWSAQPCPDHTASISKFNSYLPMQSNTNSSSSIVSFCTLKTKLLSQPTKSILPNVRLFCPVECPSSTISTTKWPTFLAHRFSWICTTKCVVVFNSFDSLIVHLNCNCRRSLPAFVNRQESCKQNQVRLKLVEEILNAQRVFVSNRSKLIY